MNCQNDIDTVQKIWDEFDLRLHKTNWFIEQMEKIGCKFLGEGLSRHTWLSPNKQYVLKVGDVYYNKTEIAVAEYINKFFKSKNLPVPKVFGASKDFSVIACEKLNPIRKLKKVNICDFTENFSVPKKSNTDFVIIEQCLTNWFESNGIEPTDIHLENLMYRKVGNKNYLVVCDLGMFNFIANEGEPVWV